MKNKFVHLHVHTEYSLLDGLSKITQMIEHVKENGMDSIAITDHGVMYGAIEFYKKAIKEGVKPIIGMEAYSTTEEHTKRPQRGKTKNYHLLLLAKNNEGYKNLMKLTSIAHLEGYYYRPRFDRKTLKKYSNGIICTSSCPLGEIGQYLIENDYKKAKDTALWFYDVFGKDYYLEIQKHDPNRFITEAIDRQIKEELQQQKNNEDLILDGVKKLSSDLGIPMVATNDTHYIKKEDAKAQDALLCVATGKLVSDTKRLRFIDVPDFYIKSPKEMSEIFKEYPEAIENSVKIAEKCEIEIELNKWFFPKYENKKGRNSDEELKIMVDEGAKKKLGKITRDIRERLEYELNIIKEKGYSTYFLIVSDMARWAIKQGIVYNTRGSAAGSLVSYTLDIVNINPLNYDLPFERFLTPWRPSPPDIDFDIADNRREEVIEYMTKKYGKEKVAQICTFGRMMAKGSVRDIARVLGYPYAVGDRISKLIPLGSQGFPMEISKALQITDDLKRLYKEDSDAKNIIDLAKQVEGNARHVSVHAAGLVISPDEIVNYTPVQLDPEGKKIITQYDMEALDPNVSPNEAIGLLKFDLLGLRNLSILGSSIEIVKAIQNKKVNLYDIPLNDKKTFEMLSHGNTMGVFQLSGSGMTRYLKDLKPERVEDLMAMVALYRPGPMSQIPQYIERKNNSEKIEYFDERMKEYLSKSYGLIVYQDDVFATAINVAGYSWEEADKFRKAVGKKIPKEMEKQKQKFIDGAVSKGMKTSKAEELFKLIEPFSGYGFNKSHAASYGMVAYQTAYMKANYPVEFMCALLTAESNDKDKISQAVHECKKMGIEVLPPDINESLIAFTIVKKDDSLEGKAIRFGLSAIKNVGHAAVNEIIQKREKVSFKSFPDFLSRVDNRKINKKVIESMIKVGAFSNFGSRKTLLSILDEVRGRVARSTQNENQPGLFSKESFESTESLGLIDTEMVDEFSNEELQSLERQLLGFSLSAKPVNEILDNIAHLATHKIFEISAQEQESQIVKIAAVINEVRIIITKRSGKEMAFVKAEDETGSIDLVVFPNIFNETKNIWVDNKPILITGKVDVRDDAPSIIVEMIQTEGFDENRDNLFIKVPSNVQTHQLKKLRNLLYQNPGNQSVTLVFDKSLKKINLGIKINWSTELSSQISLIFNEEIS